MTNKSFSSFSSKTRIVIVPAWKVHFGIIAVMLLIMGGGYFSYMALMNYQNENFDSSVQITEVEQQQQTDQVPNVEQPIPSELLPGTTASTLSANELPTLEFAATKLPGDSVQDDIKASLAEPQRLNISSLGLMAVSDASGNTEPWVEEESQESEIKPNDSAAEPISDPVSLAVEPIQSGFSQDGIRKGRLNLLMNDHDPVLIEALLVKRYGRVIYAKRGGHSAGQFHFILSGEDFDSRIKPLTQQDISSLSNRQVLIRGEAARQLNAQLFNAQAQTGYEPYLQLSNQFDHRLNDLHGEGEITTIRVSLSGNEIRLEHVP